MGTTMQPSFFILIGILTRTVTSQQRPHIIFIVADDLGWNDVGWINPDINTPNLDQLAGKGVILNSSYVQPTCTPSRAAFMTGYYPFHTGLQHGVILADQPKYVPINFSFLPQELKKLGYATALVGKWHLGFCNEIYTPTSRGFDSSFGIYLGSGDHYTHIRQNGYDFRWNSTVYKEADGKYSTDLYASNAIKVIKEHDPEKQPLFMYLAFQAPHTPLQVPKKYLKQYEHIENKGRRLYSAMVTAMDEAIGNIVTALEEKGYMDNLLLVFTSDNGAASYISGSNWPLRGAKTTLWEGGTRVPGFVFSRTLLTPAPCVSTELVHAVDWFPTLLAAAGGDPPQGIDGINQWMVLKRGQKSTRKEFIYNIDEVFGNAAIRMGDYKLIRGGSGRYNDWNKPCLKKECDPNDDDSLIQPEDGAFKRGTSTTLNSLSEYLISLAETTRSKSACDLVNSWNEKVPCARIKEEEQRTGRLLGQPDIQLYNIKEDPLEQHDIAKSNYQIVQTLSQRLEWHEKTLVKSNEPPRNPKGRPEHYNGIWTPGWC